MRRYPARPRCLQLPLDTLALFFCFAEFRPRPPRYRLTGETKRTAVPGKLVEERVSRRMVCLACVAHNARHAGEQDEHVQIPVHGRAVQMPCAKHLWPKDLLETIPTLIRQDGIRQHAHAVYNTSERRQSRLDALQHRVYRRRVRHIRNLNLHRHTTFT